jgi:hypothetical protein
MTTSISTKETEQFEEFLQSLDEINNYLDKKLKETSTTDNNKNKKIFSNYKRTKRNLTQPIFFTNELNRYNTNNEKYNFITNTNFKHIF